MSKTYPNKVRHYREEVIGWSKIELARAASTSDKTIASIEKKDKGGTATRTRVFNAINAKLDELGYTHVSREELFSPLVPAVEL